MIGIENMYIAKSLKRMIGIENMYKAKSLYRIREIVGLPWWCSG